MFNLFKKTSAFVNKSRTTLEEYVKLLFSGLNSKQAIKGYSKIFSALLLCTKLSQISHNPTSCDTQ